MWPIFQDSQFALKLRVCQQHPFCQDCRNPKPKQSA